MAIIKSYSSFLNLSNYQVYINDTKTNSEYFRITEFKETFTGGKNGFLIEGSDYLKETTEIKIEILDVEGNPIYFEPGDGIPEYYEGNSKLVSVHVYDDTPIGVGKITILGELKDWNNNGVRSPIPSEWRGVYNLKWEREFNINKNLSNETIVRFYKRPQISIDEIVKPIFSKTIQTVTDNTSTVTGIPQLPSLNEDLSNWRAGTSYKLIRSSGSWDRDVDENIITVSLDNGDTFSPKIIEVLNDREVLVDVPYTQSNLVKSFVSQSYSISYSDFQNEIIGESSLTGSFAKINMTQLKTFVGDVARVKVFRKSRNAIGDFQFVQESKLESTELLRDITTTSNTELSYGRFDESNLSTYWVSSSNDHPISIDSSILAQSVKFDYNNSVGGVQTLKTTESFNLSKDVEYTLSFKTLLNGTPSTTKNLKAYFSGSFVNGDGNNSSFTQSFVDINGTSIYQTRQNISENILSERDINGVKLVFEVEGDDWYISNVSLKNAQETSFSPDEFILIQDIPRKLPSETFDFRFEFYDINNNYIPVDVTSAKTFTGGNDFPISGKLLTFESDRNAFRFSSGSIANPYNQTIQFKTTQNNLTGSILFTSQAFDTDGNYLNPSDYTQYPGFLTNVTTAGALITLSNFTGSRTDGLQTPYVGSIVYTASLENLQEFETVYRLEDGDNAPQLIVTSNANQFIYEPTTLSPKPSGQSITIRAQRKNLASLITPLTINSGSNAPLTYVSTTNGVDTYTISALEFSSSFASSNFDEVTYSFTGSDVFGNQQTDEITLSKVVNFDGVSLVLSNESTTFPAKSTGEVIGGFTSSSGSVQLYVGGNEITHIDGLSGQKNAFDIISVSGTNVTPTDTTPNTANYSISNFDTNKDSGSLALNIKYLAGDGITSQSFQKVVSYTKAFKSAPSVNAFLSPQSQTIDSGSSTSPMVLTVKEGTTSLTSVNSSIGTSQYSASVVDAPSWSWDYSTETLTRTGIPSVGESGSVFISYKDSEGSSDSITIGFSIGVSKQGIDGAGAANIEFFPQTQQLVVDLDGNYTPDPPLIVSMSVVQGGSEYSYVAYNGSSVSSTLSSNSTYTLTNSSLCTFTSQGHVQPNSPAVNSPYEVSFDVTYRDNNGTLSNSITKKHYINIVADGSTGPGIVFTGPWSSSRTYQYDLSNGRRDAVLYGGRYYATLQSSTNQTPAQGGTAYWQDLGTEDFFVAAKIAIFEESFIQNTLNVGANNSGQLSSANITLYGADQYPYFSLGQSANVGTQGYAAGDGIFIGRDSDGEYKMSLENGTDSYLKWTGTELQIKGNISATTGTISNSVTIGATTAGNLLEKGGAAGDINANTTTINGDRIRTGDIQSNSYSGVTDGTAFATSGTNINLTNGTFTSPSFRIDTNGDAYFSGDISAGANITGASISGGTITGTTFSGATGTFSGNITSDTGNIGGWTIAGNQIYRTNEIYLNANRPAIEVHDGTTIRVDINSAAALSPRGSTSAGSITVAESGGTNQYISGFTYFSNQQTLSGIVSKDFDAGTISTSGLSGQVLTFAYGGIDSQTSTSDRSLQAELELNNIGGNTNTYYITVGNAYFDSYIKLSLIDSGGSTAASFTQYIFNGTSTDLVGSTQGQTTVTRNMYGIPSSTGPQSTTFTANGGTYTVRATVYCNFTVELYASVYNPSGYLANLDIDVKTAGYSNARVFKEVSYSELNGGGLQVIRTTTEFVKMDRTTTGTMLEVGGNITATGNITAYYSSDKRLKDNLIPIQNPFDKINKIGGYEFDWKPEYEEVHNSKGHDVGVIAQEIETSMPELVGKMHGGYMGVKYEKLTVYLLEAVKNLNNRLIELEEENKKLKG